MSDPELDERIRTGLQALVDDAPPPLPYPGRSAESDGGHAASDRRRRRRVRTIAVAAAVLALVTGAAVAIGRLDDARDVEAVDGAGGGELRSWTPGWHVLDAGAASGLANVSVAFLSGDLYLAGTRHPDSGADSFAELHRFDPVTERWSDVPAPDMVQTTIVAAGDQLVARGRRAPTTDAELREPGVWSTWSPGDRSWTDRGDVAPAAALQSLEPTSTGDIRLVWTGSRVIDLTHGTVLDPSNGSTTPLELPADIGSTALINTPATSPVWTGSRVVITAWSQQSGVAWDADGRLVGLLPPPPEVPTIGDSTGAAVDGSAVVAFAVGDVDGTTRAARLDPTSGIWTRLDDLPPTPLLDGRYCSYVVGSATGQVVAAPCAPDPAGSAPTFTLADRRWVPVGPTPSGPSCCTLTLTSGPDAVAAVSTAAPPTPLWIALWVPSIDAERSSSLPPERSPRIVIESDDGLGGTSTITVTGTGFEPRTQVGVTQCGTTPQTEAFSDLCAGGAVSVTTDLDGRFATTYRPKPRITVPAAGDVDCTGSSGACVIAAAPIGARSAVALAPLSFAGDAEGPLAEASLAVLGPIEEHEGWSRINVLATGFPADERVSISVCLRGAAGDPDASVCDLDGSLVIERFDPNHANAGELLLPRLEGDEGIVDCAAAPDRCIITTGSTTTPAISTSIQP